ncbi:MAG: hypothetical protein M1827_005815 [Pycnora praestabilis]|nr:MAG: hypothetical protein M1827_005815 [Pycnora praestabilis]
MCRICEPICVYCNQECGGYCNDPEKCPTCWVSEYYGNLDSKDSAIIDACIKNNCACGCHDWDDDEWALIEDEEPRAGVFPFLQLPGEIRNRIYGYALMASGKKRKSHTFKGKKIETAILKTNRQINKEARHIPLLINELSIVDPFHAEQLLTSIILPQQRQLINRVQVNVQGFIELNSPLFSLFCKELTKVPIPHLRITLRGGIDPDWLFNHSCLENLLSRNKGMKTFTMEICDANIAATDKVQFDENLRMKIMARWRTQSSGSIGPNINVPAPLPARKQDQSTKWPSKAARNSAINGQEKPLSNERGIPTKAEVAAKAAKKLVKELQVAWGYLAQYADSVEGTLSMHIRLASARNFADHGDETEFDKLAESIL